MKLSSIVGNNWKDLLQKKNNMKKNNYLSKILMNKKSKRI